MRIFLPAWMAATWIVFAIMASNPITQMIDVAVANIWMAAVYIVLSIKRKEAA